MSVLTCSTCKKTEGTSFFGVVVVLDKTVMECQRCKEEVSHQSACVPPTYNVFARYFTIPRYYNNYDYYTARIDVSVR